MIKIKKCQLPEESLLHAYRKNGCYTDCYTTSVEGCVTSSDFIAAFYTNGAFKVERFILSFFVGKHSSDFQAIQLARREIDKFAAWHVEGRTEEQMLLCDFQQKTRSWLMVKAVRFEGKVYTQLYFGSAVVPFKKRVDGSYTLSLGFKLLLGFHKLYSRVLLSAARQRLKKLTKKKQLLAN